MHALVLTHRWLGVVFCLLFTMWFATGIVMHFVPYPALTEEERIAGLALLNSAGVQHGPAAAVAASGIGQVERVRLFARSDGPVYIVESASTLGAVHATNLAPAGGLTEQLALTIAVDHARRRGVTAASATVVERAHSDQWTVPNGLDPHRPLYRIALGDGPGTELYVSSATGEVVRDTTRTERWSNYVGSVAHWIYPTALRRNWSAWDATVWWLSLAALGTPVAGALLGIMSVRAASGRLTSPYGGWHAWHHWLGLGCMAFVLTWILSGWLSMDHGRLFSDGKATKSESLAFTGAPAWDRVPEHEIRLLLPQVRKIEWFAFDVRMYRRERIDLLKQRLSPAGEVSALGRAFLSPEGITAASRRLMGNCRPAVKVASDDWYPIVATMPGAPVYRSVCGSTWFHIDGASGIVLEKLDPSRRSYRWLYRALHTLDFPVLSAHPSLRTLLVLVLCGMGLAFSSTALVIAWSRLRNRAPSLSQSQTSAEISR